MEVAYTRTFTNPFTAAAAAMLFWKRLTCACRRVYVWTCTCTSVCGRTHNTTVFPLFCSLNLYSCGIYYEHSSHNQCFASRYSSLNSWFGFFLSFASFKWLFNGLIPRDQCNFFYSCYSKKRILSFKWTIIKCLIHSAHMLFIITTARQPTHPHKHIHIHTEIRRNSCAYSWRQKKNKLNNRTILLWTLYFGVTTVLIACTILCHPLSLHALLPMNVMHSCVDMWMCGCVCVYVCMSV